MCCSCLVLLVASALIFAALRNSSANNAPLNCDRSVSREDRAYASGSPAHPKMRWLIYRPSCGGVFDTKGVHDAL